jgi:hypothetical protein
MSGICKGRVKTNPTTLVSLVALNVEGSPLKVLAVVVHWIVHEVTLTKNAIRTVLHKLNVRYVSIKCNFSV